MRARVSPSSEPLLRRRRSLRSVRDPALAYVEPPPSLRIAASIVGLLFLLLVALLLAMPWQQASVGSGRVIAYAPAEREQVVDAPVDGRLDRWMVSEGDRVRTGDPIVQILDNDVERVPRLMQKRRATEEELRAIEGQITSYEVKIAALDASLGFVEAEYASKTAKLRQDRVGDQAGYEAASRNRNRIVTLSAEGIASTREQELAEMSFRSASAKLEARDAEIRAMRRAGEKARAEVETKRATATAELDAARSKHADVRRKLVDIDTSLARQQQQLITAPRDGIVLRLYGGPGGSQIKKGDAVLTLVPETDSRAVELWVDGNDMPFVARGSDTRIVFEGWPALQVVGLPGASRGTFGGKVALVDAADDGTGKFRVVVVPSDDARWPDADSLRQGVRAKGWMFGARVSLAYEAWRQLNGFPAMPVIEKGDALQLPSSKKPRAPASLK